MRIVYIHQHFRTPAMSGGTRSFEFARRLVARGHSVDLITARSGPDSGLDGGSWVITEEAGVRVHWCPVPYSNAMGFSDRVAAFTRFAVQASLRARKLPQDLVFATSTPLTVAVPGVVCARTNRVPLVFEVRDVWPEVPIALGALRNPLLKRLALSLESQAYRNAAAVVVLSPGMAASVTSRFPEVDVAVIPNAADTELFGSVSNAEVAEFRRRRKWLGNRPLVLYAGTLGAVNDVGYVVQVARRMRDIDPDVRFLVVGDGKERAEIEAFAHRCDVLGTNFFMEPAVPKSKLPTFLGAADLALSTVQPVPALYANSANKVFDAFAAGCPVVINHGGWLRELLAESGAGLAVAADDPDAAASILARLVRDAAWLAGARRASRLLAAERFDRDLLFEQFERVLLRAASAQAARPGSAAALPAGS